jgi:hypothetical protein
MLEIIAIIFLSRNMGKMAKRKGQKPGPWILYTVLAWIGGEFIAALIAIQSMGQRDYLSLLPVLLIGAVIGYLIVRGLLSRLPDVPDEGFEFEQQNNSNNPASTPRT